MPLDHGPVGPERIELSSLPCEGSVLATRLWAPAFKEAHTDLYALFGKRRDQDLNLDVLSHTRFRDERISRSATPAFK